MLEFLKAYPDINARLILADHVVNLVDDQVDVAIRVGPLPDINLVAIRLGSVGWVTCASPHYLDKKGTPETPAALGQHACVMFESLYSNNHWSFRNNKAAMAQQIRPRFAVNAADAAIAAAIASAGITHVLSYQVTDADAAGSIRLFLRSFVPEPIPVHIIYGSQSQLPLKLRAFLDFAAPRLKASIP